MKSTKIICPLILLIVVNLLARIDTFAQCRSDSPEKLLDSLKESFIRGDIDNFSCLYTVESGIEFLKASIKNKNERQFAAGKILRSNGKTAFLLITGLDKFGNSGDETSRAQDFSGIYEAEFTETGWKIKSTLPYRKNIIKSHSLEVEIFPAQKLHVKDLISIDVTQNFGFAASLNHRARISRVQFNEKDVEYLFGGGFFWAKVPPGRDGKLLIEYDLEVEADKEDANSGFFGADFGHVRNQFYWHPFYDFSSETDQAKFKVVARIPKEFQIVTSLPQINTTNDAYRVVTASGEEKTDALTLLYDQNWQPITKNFGSLNLSIFSTPEFSPGVVEIQNEFEKVYQTLEMKFGKPASNYFSVVQSRARKGGWLYHTNNAIVTGMIGGRMTSEKPFPRAYFPHEIAHAWTIPTRKASNFLREGWASFAESYFLREEFGAKAEDEYFAKYRELYEKGNFEGKSSILSDSNNAGISYYKGAWIFKMLRDFLGEELFMQGMRKYILQTRLGKSDINSFVSAFSGVSKKDVAGFLKPWLEEKVLPRISAKIFGGRIEIKQEGCFSCRLKSNLKPHSVKNENHFLLTGQ